MKPCVETLAALLLALATALPAAAAVNRWSPVGPDGGDITATVFHPTNPAVVYAATSGNGIFKSRDGGASWSPAGDLPRRTSVTALALDPSRPQILYAGTYHGIYRSTDGGAGWVAAGALGLVSRLVISPAHPDVLYAVSQLNHLVRSDDRGATWRTVPLPHPSFFVDQLVASPASPSTLYVSTRGSLTPSAPAAERAEFYQTTDAGVTWSRLEPGLTAPAGASVRYALAVAPDRPQTVYATLVVEDLERSLSSLARSTDGGTTWTPQPGPGGYPLLALAGGRVLTDRAASADYAATWTALERPTPRVTALAAPMAAPTALLLGAEYQGIFRSADAGQTFAAANRGLKAASVTAMVMGADSTLYAATAGDGLVARPWQAGGWDLRPAVDAALIPGYFAFNRLAVHPRRPRLLFGQFLDPAAETLLRSGDGGFTWTDLGSPLGADVELSDLAFDSAAPDTVYASTLDEVPAGGCHAVRSTDRGATWACLPLGATSDLEVDPVNPRNLYAAGARLAKSTDRGITWTERGYGSGLPGSVLAAQLVHAPGATGHLYLATVDGQVFRSTNGGRSWRPAQGNLPRRPGLSLVVDPRDPARVYAAIPSSGVYRSRDGGGRWQALNAGFDGAVLLYGNVYHVPLAIDPRDPATLYLGTGNRGVLAFTQTN